MARTALTVTTLTMAGLAPAPTTGQADGHFFANPPASSPYGSRQAIVTNNGAAARNITFQTGATVEGVPVEEVTISIPAGATRYFGPFTPRLFNRATTDPENPSTVYVDYDAGNETDLEIEIIEFPVT